MVAPDKHQETGALREVWRSFNKLRDYCLSIRPAKGLNTRLKHTSRGTIINTQAPAPEVQEGDSIVATQYKVTAIADDYIEAKTWDGTNLGSAAVKIAKPWRLRKTGWDGVTVTYSFNGGSIPIRYAYNAALPGYRSAFLVNQNQTTSQAIIPVYSVGDIIYATEPEGGTFATVNGVDLTWLDLNVDAREWARF